MFYFTLLYSVCRTCRMLCSNNFVYFLHWSASLTVKLATCNCSLCLLELNMLVLVLLKWQGEAPDLYAIQMNVLMIAYYLLIFHHLLMYKKKCVQLPALKINNRPLLNQTFSKRNILIGKDLEHWEKKVLNLKLVTYNVEENQHVRLCWENKWNQEWNDW